MTQFHQYCTHATLALALVACTKEKAPRPDTAAAPASAPSTLRANARKAPMPGALTKPIDSYTGDELYAFVRQLQFTGGAVRERKCKNDPGCGNNQPKRVKVAVDAVAMQDSIASSDTPPFGAVYIRALNRGNADEARYGLKPGAQLEYYVIVLPDSSGGMTWRLEQLVTTPGVRRHVSAGTGQFQSCNHAWTAGARADFKSCANAAVRRDSVVRLGLALQGSDDDPMWAVCAGGCCVLVS